MISVAPCARCLGEIWRGQIKVKVFSQIMKEEKGQIGKMHEKKFLEDSKGLVT